MSKLHYLKKLIEEIKKLPITSETDTIHCLADESQNYLDNEINVMYHNIDWSRERSNINFCGYCIDATCICNGMCFDLNNHLKLDAKKNRITHIKNKIEYGNDWCSK